MELVSTHQYILRPKLIKISIKLCTEGLYSNLSINITFVRTDRLNRRTNQTELYSFKRLI